MKTVLALAALTLASLVGCGGSDKPAAAASEPEHPRGPSVGKVYDPSGTGRDCDAPRADCGAPSQSRDFLDQCPLRGYRVVRCGCDAMCTGNVAAGKQGWDAAGHAKECAPADTSCNAPAAPAAFQDACAEKGFKMSQCGCEWLCSGDVTKAH